MAAVDGGVDSPESGVSFERGTYAGIPLWTLGSVEQIENPFVASNSAYADSANLPDISTSPPWDGPSFQSSFNAPSLWQMPSAPFDLPVPKFTDLLLSTDSSNPRSSSYPEIGGTESMRPWWAFASPTLLAATGFDPFSVDDLQNRDIQELGSRVWQGLRWEAGTLKADLSRDYQHFIDDPIGATVSYLNSFPQTKLEGEAASLLVGVGALRRSGPALRAGEAGRFRDLDARAVVGDGLEPHHMPQAALNFTPRQEGGALALTRAEHRQTRNYGTKGKLTAAAEAGMSFREILRRDIQDIRSFVGTKYNEGLLALLEFYRAHYGPFMEK